MATITNGRDLQVSSSCMRQIGTSERQRALLKKLNPVVFELKDGLLKLYVALLGRRLNDVKLCNRAIKKAQETQDIESEMKWRRG